MSLLFGNHYIVTSKMTKNLAKTPTFANKQNKSYSKLIDLKNDNQLEKNSFISVGRFEKQKNFDKLIESFSNLSEEVTLIGDGSLKKDLYKLSKNLNSKINFEGILSNNE